MKKIGLVGLLVLIPFSFASSALAETDSQKTQNSTSSSEVATVISDELYEETEESNTSPTIENSGSAATVPNESETQTDASLEATTTAADNVIIELNHVDSPSATYLKGEEPKAEDFKTVLEQVLKLNLRTLAFQDGSDQSTAVLDLHTTKILATDTDDKNYLINCTYIVKSDIATLNAPTIHYDAQTNMLTGITFPYASVYFYEVGLETGEPIQIANADANGSFSISGDYFEPGRLMSVVVYSIGGVEFSDPLLFKIPLADENTTTESSIVPTEEAKTTAEQAKKASGKSFPSTGEADGNVLISSGILTLASAGSLILLKRKRMSH